MARLFTKYLFYCSIYAFVSNLTILTFSKAMDQDLLRGAYGLSYSGGLSPSGGEGGGGSPEVGGSKV